MTEEAERYWKDFEDSTGERVQAKSLGQWFKPGGPKEGVWGILILTDASLRFQGQKSENWVSNLFGSRGRTKGSPESVELAIPRESLVSLEQPPRGLLSRIFGPMFPRFTISWRLPGESAAESAVFAIDDAAGALMSVLRQALPTSGAESRPLDGKNDKNSGIS